MNNHMTGNAISPILRKIMEMRLNKEIADKFAKIMIKEILQTVRFEDGNVREATEEIDRMFCGHCDKRVPVSEPIYDAEEIFSVSGTLLILNISVIMPVTVTFSMKTVSEGSFPPIWKKLMLITRQHEEKCVNFSEDMDS